jgi:hypothetical protein
MAYFISGHGANDVEPFKNSLMNAMNPLEILYCGAV